MNILIAPDKFKHSLSSLEACEAIKKGLLKASKDFTINILPLADGGDGLSEVLQHYLSAKKYLVGVCDPLFRPINSSLLLSKDGKTAFIEMAKASGLLLLKPEEYNCMDTTSFGTGELIKAAIELNVEEIIMGIGGSATNDCGIGMAAALGYRFLDKSGKELKPVGRSLINITAIDRSKVIDFNHVKFTIACDVKNPLYGKNGATMVYARQKGATNGDIEHLEKGMISFSKIIKDFSGKDVKRVKGAGAAGGLGAGCLAFLEAELTSGIDLLLKISNAEEQIRKADIVLTGEGKIDEQTLNGKVISGIGKLCKKHHKPLLAFCGALTISDKELSKIYIKSVFTINNNVISLEEAYKNAEKLLLESAYKVGKNL